MLKRYRVRYTRTAAAQLQEIFDYIEKESPAGAAKMIGRIVDAIDTLDILPQRHAIISGTDTGAPELRSMIVRPYLIRYCVNEDPALVTVLSVRHGARRSE